MIAAVATARTRLLRSASLNVSSLKTSLYQRVEKPSNGKVSPALLLNENKTTKNSGTNRNSRAIAVTIPDASPRRRITFPSATRRMPISLNANSSMPWTIR